jgi:hypothetical protein
MKTRYQIVLSLEKIGTVIDRDTNDEYSVKEPKTLRICWLERYDSEDEADNMWRNIRDNFLKLHNES